MSSQAVHRSGPLKQQNKTHKHGRHKSKGELSSIAKGRVSMKSSSRKPSKEQRKNDRRNKMKQLRANKRHESLLTKRSIGVEGSPPHMIVVVPLSPEVDSNHIHSLLCEACEGGENNEFNPVSTLISSQLKQRFTIVHPPPNNLYALLDIAMVADTLLLVYKGWEELSLAGNLTLDCLAAQGLPTTLHVIQGSGEQSGKALTTAKKTLQKNIEKKFPSDKIYQMNSLKDASNVLRAISTHKHRSVHFTKTHPHMLVESMTFAPSEGEEHGTLKVSGYVRGKPLSVNGLIHLPNLGDFQMSQIDGPVDPHPLKPRHARKTNKDYMDTGCNEDEEMEEEVKVLQVANPAEQCSLESEVTLDPMEGEQTWPTEDDLKETEVSNKGKKRVPEGTSDYQAAWIVDSGSEDEDESCSDEELAEVSLPAATGCEEDSDEEDDERNSVTHSEMDTDTMTLPDTDKYDASYDEDSDRIQLEKLRAEREDQMFPDEIDTPQDIPARTRFQKYRGLKSFRDSPWDRKENLPRDYARIFQFENFRCTRKHVLARAEEEGVLPGWYVTVHIARVPRSYAESIDPLQYPLVIYGLLPHENKMSVVHFALRRTPNCSLPVKSKDQLVFHTGLRRFTTNPIFSQHTTGDKHKFERFFHPDMVCVATAFAPIGYPPQPVLVFKPEQGHHILVATGSLYSVNPDRVVCKRVVLSGHPLKIHKKSAVIRYMFFNRDDIQWFKPVELRTKHGRRGHIKEPLGTHGHMKCVFDGHLKAQDTVLMNLYKRVFPKWTYSLSIPSPLSWIGGNMIETEEMENNDMS